MAFLERYGPWALVAGAAEGLGSATAEGLAQRGLHLVLVDRQADALEGTAARLSAAYGIDTLPITQDLAAADAIERVSLAVGDREVGLLAYIAAAAPVGPFLEDDLAAHAAAVAVNCAGPLAVIHRWAPAMVERGRGGVLLFSSLAGFQGSAHIATYAATKAFDLVLGESLHAELEPSGVDVLTVCPGPTRTPAYEASRPAIVPAPVMSPAAVAEAALAALGRRAVTVPGWANRIGRWVLTLMGRRRAVATVSRTTLRMYPPRDG